MIKHLHIFDDLTHHVCRLAGNRMSAAQTAAVLRRTGRHLSAALACLDWADQDYALSTWEGAAIELAWELADRDAQFDLLVSQGCNGGYAADTLLDSFARKHGRPLAAASANVRVTHYLDDRDDAFYSSFEIGVSAGAPLADQCRIALDQTSGMTERPVIAVIDDCIQTGQGTRAVVEELLALRPDAAIWTLGFIACEATQNGFRNLGWRPVQGVLLRGETYPASWDTDVYFTKDWILENAIRFRDGTSCAYIDDAGWMAQIFGAEPGAATIALRELRDELAGNGLYEELLAL